MTTPENTKTRRLFLALWPDDAVRNQVLELQQEIAGNKLPSSAGNIAKNIIRPVIRKNFHLTLHFIGSATEDETMDFIKSLDKVKCSAFNLVIDRSGYFKQAKSFWLGVNTIPEQLERLVIKTGECVERCFESYSLGYHHRNFRPHITLFRKANSKITTENFAPITWQIKNFVLVESKTYSEGVEYMVLNRWALK